MSPNFPKLDRRSSGLLLHPTSLPGPHGSGDLGPEAYRFVDSLAQAKQTWWQMLPVTPPGSPPGISPYSSFSAFAGSPWLVSLERIADDGLVTAAEIEGSPRGLIAVNRYRLNRLERAFERFGSRRELHDEFDAFCEAQRNWLPDYALFAALKQAHRGAPWSSWSKALRLRRPGALREARRDLANQIRFHEFVQFQFDRQWGALRRYARGRSVGLIGDIPIFVAHDSADVWAHRDLFLLDGSGAMRSKSGYPPDAFNVDGQSWGHPHYDWTEHERTRYAWWIARFAATYRWFDAARIDHFLGFHRCWHIPGAARNARRGKWVCGPGAALFTAVRRTLGTPPIIAEDLGQLTAEAAALREKFHFPGMRVLQFGFGAGGDYHLPHRYPRRCVAYTGTHDNSTIVGWMDRLRRFSRNGRSTPAARAEHAKAIEYLQTRGRDLHLDAIRALMMSVADTVIFPVQDVLGLGEEARMNRPGTVGGNWLWRMRPGELTSAHAQWLAEMCELYDRLPPPLKPAEDARVSRPAQRQFHRTYERC